MDINDSITISAKIYSSLTVPVTKEMLLTAYNLGMIPKSKLIIGKKYVGFCRNAREAIWTGTNFNYERHKFGNVFRDSVECPEDDRGTDIFVPVAEVNNDIIDLIHEKLKQFFVDDTFIISVWFNTEQSMLGSVKPIDMIIKGQEDKLLKFIENCLNGELP